MACFLVVDDERPLQQLLQEMFETEGHEVVIAGGGVEALALFDGRKFDAVFTDLGMPGIDGWELARRLRERDKQIPLVVITGWGEIISAEEKAAAQVDEVLTKPISLEEIAGIAQRVLRLRKRP